MRDVQWAEWIRKQERGLQDYLRPDPEGKAYVQELAAEFWAFCEPEGLILDVGCGIDPLPAYAVTSSAAVFVGLDPLLGPAKHAFEFVRAVGEQMPFRSAIFDWSLNATALDHVVDPLAVLGETRRVLRTTGSLALWVGVINPKTLNQAYGMPSLRDHERRARLRRMLKRKELGTIIRAALHHMLANRIRRLSLPWRLRFDQNRLVKDLFRDRALHHFRFYRRDQVLALFNECGLTVVKYRVVSGEGRGDSLFVVARAGT